MVFFLWGLSSTKHEFIFWLVEISQDTWWSTKITYLKSHQIIEAFGVADWLKFVFKGDYAFLFKPFNYEKEERKITYFNG